MKTTRKTAIYAFAAVAALTTSACGSSGPDNLEAASAPTTGTPIDSSSGPDEGAGSDSSELPTVATEAPTTEAPTTEAPTTEAPTTEAPASEPAVAGSLRDDIVGCETTGPDGNGGASQVKVLIQNQSAEARDYFVEGIVTSADDPAVQEAFIASITQAQPGTFQTEPARIVDYGDGEPFVEENFAAWSEDAASGDVCTVVNVEEPEFMLDDGRSDELTGSCAIDGNAPDGTVILQATVLTETAGLVANARVALTRDGATVETLDIVDFEGLPVGDVTMYRGSLLVADAADVECKLVSATEVVF